MSASTATAEEAKSEQTPYGSKPASNEEEAWSKPSEEFCEGGGTIRGVEDAAGTEELSCDNDGCAFIGSLFGHHNGHKNSTKFLMKAQRRIDDRTTT